MSLLTIAFGVVWLGMISLTELSAPADNIEQLTWVRGLAWGYYKHPPLPTWLLWLPVQAFGLSVLPSYVLGAACTLCALLLQWWQLKNMRGRDHANLALLAMLCITYYNGRLNYYNHEVVLLLMSSIAAVLCRQAMTTGRLRWWIALGAALGLGALAKYQIAVTVACVLVCAAWAHWWRSPRQRVGLLSAVLVALMLFAPHIEWLRRHDFGPVHYALASSVGAALPWAARVSAAGHWLADQFLNRGLPSLILLAVAAASLRAPADRWIPAPGDGARIEGRSHLILWGLVPMIFMPAFAIASGSELPLHWGTPFLLFAVPAAMELVPAAWHRVRPATVLKAFFAIQLLLLAVAALSAPRGPWAGRTQGWQAFDTAAAARPLIAKVRARLHGPVRVIEGEAAVAGALALQLPERPLVLIDGNRATSPWVGADTLARCGALVVWRRGAGSAGGADAGSRPRLGWRLLAPAPAAGPCPH